MDKPAQWALVGAAWFLALSVAALGFLAWRHFEAIAPETAPAAVGSSAELAAGATAICPVTGEHLVITANTPHLVYQDRVYYFSSVSDAAGVLPKRRFLMDPESFVHPGVAPSLAAQEAVAQATVAASQPTALPTAAPTALPQPRSATAHP